MNDTVALITQGGAVAVLVLVTYGFLAGKVVARWVHDAAINREREWGSEWKERALKGEKELAESVETAKRALARLEERGP